MVDASAVVVQEVSVKFELPAVFSLTRGRYQVVMTLSDEYLAAARGRGVENPRQALYGYIDVGGGTENARLAMAQIALNSSALERAVARGLVVRTIVADDDLVARPRHAPASTKKGRGRALVRLRLGPKDPDRP